MSKLTKKNASITMMSITMVVLTGCASSKDDSAINALSIKTSADTVSEIQQAITTIQDNQMLPLIESNTFETNSHLLIVPEEQIENGNMQLNNTEVEFIEEYTLQLRDKECGVYYEKGDKFIPLSNIQCRPNPIQD